MKSLKSLPRAKTPAIARLALVNAELSSPAAPWPSVPTVLSVRTSLRYSALVRVPASRAFSMPAITPALNSRAAASACVRNCFASISPLDSWTLRSAIRFAKAARSSVRKLSAPTLPALARDAASSASIFWAESRSKTALTHLTITLLAMDLASLSGRFTPWGGAKASLGWIEDERGCHIWTGSRNNNGYAEVTFRGRRWLVHRLRYNREVRELLPGEKLDHYVCDNGTGGCCNPLHCRPASQRENILRSDSPASHAAAKTHCERGHPLVAGNL